MPGSLSTTVNNTVDGPTVVNPLDSERAATDLWTRAIHRLKGRLSRHTFQTYFEPIKPVSLEGDELTLAHSSRFMIDWVRDNLLDVLLQDLEAQLGRTCAVKFVVRERAPGEDVEQVVAHPVDHELARVGQGELVVDEADWFDRLEVGLEGVAAQATLQPIDGSSPQIEGGALGFH